MGNKQEERIRPAIDSRKELADNSQDLRDVLTMVLLTVRNHLDQLAVQRLIRNLSAEEAARYGELCKREKDLLARLAS